MKRPYVLMAEENIVAEGSPNPACPPGAMIQNSLIQGGEAPKNLPIVGIDCIRKAQKPKVSGQGTEEVGKTSGAWS